MCVPRGEGAGGAPLASLLKTLLFSLVRPVLRKKGVSEFQRKVVELERVLNLDPNNAPARVTLAGLLARRGLTRRAVYHYSYLALAYLREESYLKAIALLQLVLQLDPGRLGTRETLARLYRSLNLRQASILQYRHLARSYTLGGRVDRCLECLHAILDLDPHDAWARRKLQDLSFAN